MVISVAIVNPLVLIVVFIGAIYMRSILNEGKKTMIDTQKLDSIVRGPIHSTFGMIVGGLVTLRQYNKCNFFEIDFLNNLEKSCNCAFSYIISGRWLGFRLDMTAFFFAAATAFCVVLVKNENNSAELSFVL